MLVHACMSRYNIYACILTDFQLHDLNVLFTYLQVYRCLQPLMLCLSHQGTLNAIDELCAGYDEDVLQWRDALMSYMDPLRTEVRN